LLAAGVLPTLAFGLSSLPHDVIAVVPHKSINARGKNRRIGIGVESVVEKGRIGRHMNEPRESTFFIRGHTVGSAPEDVIAKITPGIVGILNTLTRGGDGLEEDCGF